MSTISQLVLEAVARLSRRSAYLGEVSPEEVQRALIDGETSTAEEWNRAKEVAAALMRHLESASPL